MQITSTLLSKGHVDADPVYEIHADGKLVAHAWIVGAEAKVTPVGDFSFYTDPRDCSFEGINMVCRFVEESIFSAERRDEPHTTTIALDDGGRIEVVENPEPSCPADLYYLIVFNPAGERVESFTTDDPGREVEGIKGAIAV